MTSLFKFMSDAESEDPAPEAPELADVEAVNVGAQTAEASPETPMALLPASTAAATTPTSSAFASPQLTGAPDQTTVLAEMLGALNTFLLPSTAPLPPPSVSVVQLTERPVGVGNFRGNETLNGLTSVALKGGRLSATVRFQLWAATPQGLEAVADSLHGRLLAAKQTLWNLGFLRLTAQGATDSAPVNALSDWRKTLDYSVLYEYRYRDTDGAQSLIARIPIHSDLEELASLLRETNVITNGLARWDNLSAPPLLLSGRGAVSQLSALFFAANTVPTGAVRLLRTVDGSSAPPTVYATLPTFLSAVTSGSTPERNGQVTFNTFSDFLAAFSSSGNALSLGDWDEDTVPDEYNAHQLSFAPAIPLQTSHDRLYIVYAPGVAEPKFDQAAVLYLRNRSL